MHFSRYRAAGGDEEEADAGPGVLHSLRSPRVMARHQSHLAQEPLLTGAIPDASRRRAVLEPFLPPRARRPVWRHAGPLQAALDSAEGPRPRAAGRDRVASNWKRKGVAGRGGGRGVERAAHDMEVHRTGTTPRQRRGGDPGLTAVCLAV
jgi:hypothetical protein